MIRALQMLVALWLLLVDWACGTGTIRFSLEEELIMSKRLMVVGAQIILSCLWMVSTTVRSTRRDMTSASTAAPPPTVTKSFRRSGQCIGQGLSTRLAVKLVEPLVETSTLPTEANRVMPSDQTRTSYSPSGTSEMS